MLRRRCWSAAEKAAIIAESLAPRAVASTVALRYGLHRNQLYMWRRELRSGVLANLGAAVPDFVPIVSESRAARRTAAVEIEIGGAVLHADTGVDLAFLGKIVRHNSRSAQPLTPSDNQELPGVLRVASLNHCNPRLLYAGEAWHG